MGLSIVWASGRTTKISDSAWTNAGSPGIPASRIEYRLDDLAGGLYVDVSHWARSGADEAPLPDMAPPLRGAVCRPVFDDTYLVFDSTQVEEIVSVSLDDQMVLYRSPMTGKLMNLRKLYALHHLFFESEQIEGVYTSIVALAEKLEAFYAASAVPAEDIEACVLRDLGVDAQELAVARASMGVVSDEGDWDEGEDDEGNWEYGAELEGDVRE